jgi:hypothetical protein
METRKVVAMATLAALPTFTTVANNAPSAITHPNSHGVSDAAHARWAWAVGMSKNEAALFGLMGALECWFVPGVGSVVCTAVGLW